MIHYTLKLKFEQKLPFILPSFIDNNLTITNNSKCLKLKNVTVPVYKVLFLVKSYSIYALIEFYHLNGKIQLISLDYMIYYMHL